MALEVDWGMGCPLALPGPPCRRLWCVRVGRGEDRTVFPLTGIIWASAWIVPASLASAEWRLCYLCGKLPGAAPWGTPQKAVHRSGIGLPIGSFHNVGNQSPSPHSGPPSAALVLPLYYLFPTLVGTGQWMHVFLVGDQCLYEWFSLSPSPLLSCCLASGGWSGALSLPCFLHCWEELDARVGGVTSA